MRSALTLVAAIAAVSPAAAHKLTVTADECAQLTAHEPDASVAYRPGSTSDGRSVAPADLPGSGASVSPPENFTIEINVDLQERFGIPPVSSQYMGDAKLGTVEIRNGRAFFNGQELAAGGQHAVLEACRELRTKR